MPSIPARNDHAPQPNYMSLSDTVGLANVLVRKPQYISSQRNKSLHYEHEGFNLVGPLCLNSSWQPNEFGHQETRDGDNPWGFYYVQLPDGRLQTVKYFVDGASGYVAEINYEGEANYPESVEFAESAESRKYRPPRPQYVYDFSESR
ncbi:uncharacterized protein LOC119596664 [Penaeus monodon]|uniref:uncharacterized protein LOC119596664 n=1 Tax=Penaeus monodon TaxID=6687 RepID=UPI0018A7AB12|nr:uncharacterized protein LOC119596664 [Penaeus monodon]